MNRPLQFISILMMFSTAPALRGDQVQLKNGDRLSGAIVKCDGKNLIFKSEFAGTVIISWAAVTAISSQAPFNVGLKEGQVLVGPISMADQKLEVQTEGAGKITTTKDAVEFMRSKEEQAAYVSEIERYRNPRLVDLWTGFVDLGLAASRGNASTSSVNVNANASRTTSRDKIGVHFTSLYASSDATGKPAITANAMRGGVSYELNVAPKLFAFGSADMEFDQFQDLDLRFSPAGGFGYKAFKTSRSALDLLGGVSLNREFFSTGLNRTSGEALLGEEYRYKLSEKTSFREKLVVFPNLTNSGSYRMNFDTSAVTGLWKWLSWQATVSDRLLSDPVPGRKKNDLLLTTGFRITFAR